MTDTTPLPCPFCGGINLRVAYMRATSDCAFWRVECADPACDAGTYGPSANTEAEALTAWNTRANAHPRLVEALREAIGAIEDDSGLDEAICCSGHDCGCRASTHRDLLLHNLRAALSEVSQ